MEEEKASTPEPVADAQPSPEHKPAQATSAIASFLSPQKATTSDDDQAERRGADEGDGEQEDGAQPADHSEE